MKPTLLTLGIVAIVGIYACQTSEKKNEETPTQATAETPTVDSIVRDTVTNKEGVKLAMAYDNAAHTATFVLKGEEIQLKQDTTASGIKYSNSDYEYTEHQGVMILKKRGNVVFSKKP